MADLDGQKRLQGRHLQHRLPAMLKTYGIGMRLLENRTRYKEFGCETYCEGKKPEKENNPPFAPLPISKPYKLSSLLSSQTTDLVVAHSPQLQLHLLPPRSLFSLHRCIPSPKKHHATQCSRKARPTNELSLKLHKVVPPSAETAVDRYRSLLLCI